MKNLILVFVCCLLLSPLQLTAQFEGVVESKNLTTDETGLDLQYVMTMWVKGEMVKIVIPPMGQNPGTTMIYRRDRKMMWTLDEKDKTYFEVMLSDESGGGQGKALQGDDASAAPKITGKKKTILGYSCDQLILRNGETETEFWGTKKLPALLKTVTRVFSGMSSDQGGLVDDEITKMGYFPLVARTRLQGKVVESSEVTRIDARPLGPELFDIPSGYRKQGVNDLMKKEGVQQQ
jgi:hypothetical protein